MHNTQHVTHVTYRPQAAHRSQDSLFTPTVYGYTLHNYHNTRADTSKVPRYTAGHY